MNKAFYTLIRISFFLTVSVIIGACTDHSYDFDRTNPDVTLIGEDITLPLGNTGPLTIESVLGEKMADYFVSLEDGTCALQYKGKPVNFVFDELKNIDGATPFQRFCDFPISYDFQFLTKPENVSFDTQGEADLTPYIPSKVNVPSMSKSLDVSVTGLPTQLASLKAITLSTKSRVEITVSVPDCPFTSGTIIPDLTFDMGNFMESEDFPGGIIKISSPLTSGNGYSATTSIQLHRFALDPKYFNPDDHSLNVNASLKFSGTCSVSQPRTNRDRYAKAPKDIKLNVTVILREIACKEIEGSFSYSRRQQVTFPMSDFASGMMEKLSDDTRFEFLDPTILLDIESNITIPISAQLELAARQKKSTYAQVKGIPILFPVADPGAYASTRYRMSKNPAKVPGEDPIALDFTELLSRIPDDLLITANASTLSDKTAVLRIGENYRVSVSPQIIIPLSFGSETKVVIQDKVSLPEQMGSMFQKNSLRIMGEIENGFPLQLAFSLVMVDEAGVPLTETARQTLAADATSNIDLTLTTLSGVDPTKLTSAILSFEAEGSSGGRSVKIDDAIQARLYAVIPGGYHLSL